MNEKQMKQLLRENSQELIQRMEELHEKAVGHAEELHEKAVGHAEELHEKAVGHAEELHEKAVGHAEELHEKAMGANTKLFQRMEERFEVVDNRFEKAHHERNDIRGAVTEISAQVRDYHNETLVMTKRIDRLRDAIKQIAKETGVQLSVDL